MSGAYDVVGNERGDRSLWRVAGGPAPRGWTVIGPRGTREECLEWLEREALAVKRREAAGATPVGAPAVVGPKAGPAVVIPLPNPGATSQVVVFPHAGSGVTYYHFLAKAMADTTVQVVLVLYPGRELRMRDTPLETMESLVDLLEAELGPALGGRPYRFFGHSMGALAAFELTHRLREAGRPLPERLYLSGRQPPHVATNVLRMDGLSDEAFLDAVGHRYGAIPAAILANRELCDLILRSMRADFVLMERYRWRGRPPLPVPMTLLNGRADRWIDEATVQEWRRYTTGEVRSRFFAGDHFYLTENAAGLKTALTES